MELRIYNFDHIDAVYLFVELVFCEYCNLGVLSIHLNNTGCAYLVVLAQNQSILNKDHSVNNFGIRRAIFCRLWFVKDINPISSSNVSIKYVEIILIRTNPRHKISSRKHRLHLLCCF